MQAWRDEERIDVPAQLHWKILRIQRTTESKLILDVHLFIYKLSRYFNST